MKRADARRNEQALLDAAGRVFVRDGVDAPVRAVAGEAGVGMGTIYRHFPTRADLVVAVFQHQLEALVEAGEAPGTSLREWVLQFVDFLVTKHGLADAMRGDRQGFERLHGEFVERLAPVCGRLLNATGIDREPLDVLRAVGNLCIGAEDPNYDARAMVEVFLEGLDHS